MRRRARPSARVLVPLTPAQRALDPLHEPPRRGRDARLLHPLGLTASLAVHAAVVALGFAAASTDARTAAGSSRRVTITMRPDPPPPPPRVTPPPPEPPAPPVQPPPPRAPRPRKPVPSPPPLSEPPPPAAPAEPRAPVVGVQPESLLEGGSGPAFAAGHTLAGTTDGVARARDEIERTRARAQPVEPTPITPGQGLALTFPRRKRPVRPEYPALLERQGIEADVQVRVDLDREGRVARVSILTPAAQPEFNRAARETALAEQFEPARRGGEPVPYSLSFTYRFRLETGR